MDKIGYDKNGKEIGLGDKCRFEYKGEKIIGKVAYCSEYFA